MASSSFLLLLPSLLTWSSCSSFFLLSFLLLACSSYSSPVSSRLFFSLTCLHMATSSFPLLLPSLLTCSSYSCFFFLPSVCSSLLFICVQSVILQPYLSSYACVMTSFPLSLPAPPARLSSFCLLLPAPYLCCLFCSIYEALVSASSASSCFFIWLVE